MALKEWNIALGGDKTSIVKNASVTAVTAAASTLGGTYSVRVLIDDAVTPSKQDAVRLLSIIEQTLTEGQWPPF